MALAGQFVGLTSLRSCKCYEYQPKANARAGDLEGDDFAVG